MAKIWATSGEQAVIMFMETPTNHPRLTRKKIAIGERGLEKFKVSFNTQRALELLDKFEAGDMISYSHESHMSVLQIVSFSKKDDPFDDIVK